MPEASIDPAKSATVVPGAPVEADISQLAEVAARFHSSRHRTVAEDAYAILHAAISTGKLAPGQRLPIRDLALAVGTSPMPVREALRRLDADGLVDNIPHRGASVAKLSIEDLAQIYEARLALEPLAVRLAAANFGPDDARRAKEALVALDRAVESEDETGAWSAHTAFHFALYRPSRSGWLERLIMPLWESSERYRLASLAKRSMSGRGQEHRRMLNACVAHDGGRAARALHNHLVKTANAVSAAMGGNPRLFEPVLRGAGYPPPVTATR